MNKGLQNDQILKYWNNRFSTDGKTTVGLKNNNIEQQNKNYQIRIDFIKPNINFDLYTLDYGCGVGRYSHLFDSEKYIGFDICDNLLNIAKEENPNYKYRKANKDGTLGNARVKNIIEQIFMSTVLQHNSDEQILNILKSFEHIVSNNFSMVLYENTSNNKSNNYMVFRTSDQYLKLIKKIYFIDYFNEKKHIIHNEQHSLFNLSLRKKK